MVKKKNKISSDPVVSKKLREDRALRKKLLNKLKPCANVEVEKVLKPFWLDAISRMDKNTEESLLKFRKNGLISVKQSLILLTVLTRVATLSGDQENMEKPRI